MTSWRRSVPRSRRWPTPTSILHVADAASPDLDEQIDAVRRVLGEIGAGDIPEVLALNKIDQVARLGPGAARAPVPRIRGRLRADGRGGRRVA